jgi:hypothetical protein
MKKSDAKVGYAILCLTRLSPFLLLRASDICEWHMQNTVRSFRFNENTKVKKGEKQYYTRNHSFMQPKLEKGLSEVSNVIHFESTLPTSMSLLGICVNIPSTCSLAVESTF